MVIHQGYCRPLKKKVDFPVDSVEALSTKKGEKWIVRGSYEGYKITTFVSKQKGEELLSSIKPQEIEEVEVFGAEIAHIPAEEVEVFDAEEVVLEAPKIEHDMLEAKHYRKDGTLDMRYKICREVARSKDAETLEDYTPEELATSNVNVGDITVDAGKGGYGAEEDEQEDDEIDDIVTDVAIDSMFDAEAMSCPPATQDVAINTKNRNLTIEKFGYGPLNVDEPGDFWEKIAEQWNTTVKAAKKSKCGNCVAFDESPRMKDCMPGETSDGEGTLGYCWMHHFKCHSARTCDTWAKGGPITTDAISHEWQEKAFGKSKASDMATSATKTKVAAAETKSKSKSSSTDPDLIIFEEHIPPEVWNKMSSSEKGKYISTRDETLLIAPCCGVSKAELRKDVDANYECTSCCFSGDDFHPRWWASEPAPSVRTTMDAEDFMDDSLNPNTAVVPNQVYYSMMMNLPDGVSVTQTEDGTSMILGFHNQNAARVQGLIEIYSPREDDGSEGDTLVSQEPVSFVPTVHFPEAKMNDFDAEAFSEAMNAESFDVEFEEWGKQEMKTHGKDISFNDWLMEEAKSHGDMPLVEWAKDEEKSHDERYGAEETFEAENEEITITDIDWETDGEDVELPLSVMVPSDLEEDEIADYLSDNYGFLVNGFVMGAESFDEDDDDWRDWGEGMTIPQMAKALSKMSWDEVDEETGYGDDLFDWFNKWDKKSQKERETYALRVLKESYGAESFEAEYSVDKLSKMSFKEIDRKSGFLGDMLANFGVMDSWSKLSNSKRKEILNKIKKQESWLGWKAESFEAESDRPLNKTVIGLLGIGALGAIFAPKQIKALFDKLK